MAEERSAKDIIIDNSLNEYESAVFRGIRQSRGSQAVKSKAISEAISKVMNAEVSIDGDRMPVAEALVVKVVGEALANPSTGKLKDLAAILGDMGATKVEVVHSAVDDELARAAIGGGLDGEE